MRNKRLWYSTPTLLVTVLTACACLLYWITTILNRSIHQGDDVMTLSRQGLKESVIVTNKTLVALTQKLTASRPFLFEHDDENDEHDNNNNIHQDQQNLNDKKERKFISQQFLHLHHMKTGGTSLDVYLRCAKDRLRHDRLYNIPYTTIHECSATEYEKCKSGKDEKCNHRINNAAMMSYCAPLQDLPRFGWNPSLPQGAMTVLRHPVDRVWSMYRFETKDCYHCLPLIDIYQMMDAEDDSLQNQQNQQQHVLESTCLDQLQNHLVTNMVLTNSEDNTNIADMDDSTKLSQAITSMTKFFTMIGLTEQLDDTMEMAGIVFPWMKSQVDWSNRTCKLSHTNKSPMSNHCGVNHSHWDLQDQPDDETRAAIEAHNQLDLKLLRCRCRTFRASKTSSFHWTKRLNSTNCI